MILFLFDSKIAMVNHLKKRALIKQFDIGNIMSKMNIYLRIGNIAMDLNNMQKEKVISIVENRLAHDS